MSHVDLPMLKSIRRLLRAGERHAEIARRFDLGVGTINRISSERKLRRVKLHLLTEADLPEDDAPPDYLAANLRRCEGCGGMVYHWPCILCRIRDAQAAGIVLPDEEEEAENVICEEESGAEGEWEQGDVGEGALVGRGSPDPAPARTEGFPSREETCGQRFGEVRRPAPHEVISTQYQVPSNALSRSPPLPLAPSFTSTEASHAHT